MAIANGEGGNGGEQLAEAFSGKMDIVDETIEAAREYADALTLKALISAIDESVKTRKPTAVSRYGRIVGMFVPMSPPEMVRASTTSNPEVAAHLEEAAQQPGLTESEVFDHGDLRLRGDAMLDGLQDPGVRAGIDE